MATYDVPDMIPAAIMSSSSLKGSAARENQGNLCKCSIFFDTKSIRRQY
jgi:hypothetical protein